MQPTTYSGDAALSMLHRCLDAMGPSSLGGIVGYAWDNGLATAERLEPKDVSTSSHEPSGFLGFSLIIVDAGEELDNGHLLLWKYVYHPLSRSGTYFPESSGAHPLASA